MNKKIEVEVPEDLQTSAREYLERDGVKVDAKAIAQVLSWWFSAGGRQQAHRAMAMQRTRRLAATGAYAMSLLS